MSLTTPENQQGKVNFLLGESQFGTLHVLCANIPFLHVPVHAYAINTVNLIKNPPSGSNRGKATLNELKCFLVNYARSKKPSVLASS